MSKRSYDPELRTSEHGARLYQAWKRVRRGDHCAEWKDFPAFYSWAMQNGYSIGAWLRLIDESVGYCPSNCVWYVPCVGSANPTKSWEDEWNKTVNRIRKHYGMPPVEEEHD